ncbi:unnamed protein product, partial [Closterium sp. NIES-54]
FLPQDRVCAFAGMSPIQLLEETQRAVGDPQLSQQHAFLKDQQDALATLHATLVSHEEQLGKLQQANAQVEVDVEKVQRREAILKEVALMKKKVPWLKYERMKRHVREMEVAVEARLKERDDLQTQVMAARDPLVALKESRGGFASLVAKIGRENEARERKLRELSEESDQLVQQAVERQRDVLEAKKKAESREQRLAKAQADLQQLEAQLAALPEVKPPKAAVDPLAKRGRELRMQAGEKEREGRQLEQQMSALREQMGRVERRVESFDAGRVNVIDPDAHAACLEQHVPVWVWKAFVTTVPEDRDFLVRHLKPLGLAVVNESSRPEELGPPAHAMAVDAHLQRLGVTHRLDEVFNAAPVVRSVLNQQSQLFRSFVGSQEADRNAEAIQERGVEDLWTPESHYRWLRSRYNGSLSINAHGVRPSRFFSQESGLQEEEQLQAERERIDASGRELQERANAVRREQRALEAEAAQCERQRDEIVNEYHGQKKQRTNLQDRIVQKRRLVEESGQSENMEEVERRARVDIAVSMERQLGNAKKTHVREREGEFKDLDEQLLKLQQDVMREEDRVQAAKQEAAAALETARGVVDLRRDEEAKRLFETLPDSLEELQEEVEERIGQANRIVCPNPHVLQQFQERQEQIRSMQGKVESERQQLEELRAEVERVQGLWLPRLRSLIIRINEAFSRNFQEMAVAGEVGLDERGADFRSYGIRIRVKFRESAELQDLSAHHQSGGERSVSTILYLVSLQDLTRCPFRVVDEINQGMDPTNERNMFQQLVRAATHHHTPHNQWRAYHRPFRPPVTVASDSVGASEPADGPAVGPANERASKPADEPAVGPADGSPDGPADEPASELANGPASPQASEPTDPPSDPPATAASTDASDTASDNASDTASRDPASSDTASDNASDTVSRDPASSDIASDPASSATASRDTASRDTARAQPPAPAALSATRPSIPPPLPRRLPSCGYCCGGEVAGTGGWGVGRREKDQNCHLLFLSLTPTSAVGWGGLRGWW